jgi:hypothetical protein
VLCHLSGSGESSAIVVSMVKAESERLGAPAEYSKTVHQMKQLSLSVLAALVSFAVSLFATAAPPSGGGAAAILDARWTPLFDGKSLAGWYVQIQKLKRGEDPAKFFQVHDGVIHVYKDQPAGTPVPNGYIATDGVYANYDLRIEYKWGTKKFQPRLKAVRDAGLLYHVTRPDTVWPRCVECQIQEGDVGDCFLVGGVQLVTNVEVVPIQRPGGVKKLPRYKEPEDGGETRKIGDRGIVRIVKSSTQERDGWNTVELIVRGSRGSEHIVNGKTVFRATELKQLGSPLASPLKKGEVDERKWEPLAQGRIALQCEYSEVFYRNIEIRGISAGELEGKTKE